MNITKLPSSRWQDYKTLRLEAVENNPQSFLSTPQETIDEPDSEWQIKIDNMFFAVDEADKLVGMIGCYTDPKEKLKHTANIVSFYVKPEYRGKGIGRQLLQTAVQSAKENPQVKKVQLSVITTQENAYQLYLSTGFQKVGELKMSLQVDGVLYDEYLMEMYIDN